MPKLLCCQDFKKKKLIFPLWSMTHFPSHLLPGGISRAKVCEGKKKIRKREKQLKKTKKNKLTMLLDFLFHVTFVY